MDSIRVTPTELRMAFETAEEPEGICVNCLRVESKCDCVPCGECGTMLAPPGDPRWIYEAGLQQLPVHARFLYATAGDALGRKNYCRQCWEKLHACPQC